MVGKTIDWVDTKAVNAVTFHFTDGTKTQIDCDEIISYDVPIGVIQVTETA